MNCETAPMWFLLLLLLDQLETKKSPLLARKVVLINFLYLLRHHPFPNLLYLANHIPLDLSVKINLPFSLNNLQSFLQVHHRIPHSSR
jgi:hypothetical protein